jgi:hypothetical protein
VHNHLGFVARNRHRQRCLDRDVQKDGALWVRRQSCVPDSVTGVMRTNDPYSQPNLKTISGVASPFFNPPSDFAVWCCTPRTRNEDCALRSVRQHQRRDWYPDFPAPNSHHWTRSESGRLAMSTSRFQTSGSIVGWLIGSKTDLGSTCPVISSRFRQEQALKTANPRMPRRISTSRSAAKLRTPGFQVSAELK